MAHRQQRDDGECPVCGQPYEELVVIERGDSWSDIHAGTPLSFFRSYARRCTSEVDVEAGERLQDRERALYFHQGTKRASIM